MTVETKYGKIAAKEISVSKHIPFICHIDKNTVETENSDLIQVIKLAGVSFETIDNDIIEALHEQRNILLRSIASDKIAIWTTIIRKRDSRYPVSDYAEGFAKRLNQKYQEKVSQDRLYKNDLYISIVFRNKRTIKATDDYQKKRNLKQFHEITKKIIAGLGAYEPNLLGAYKKNNYLYSRVLEFFGCLVNGSYAPVPLSRQDIKYTLAKYRLSFGTEAGEIRHKEGKKYFGALAIKEYCSTTRPGCLDSILELPQEFVLTQTFTFAHRQKAIEHIQLQRDRLIVAGDLSTSQIEELEQLLDDIASNKIVAGHHDLTLITFSDTINELDSILADADSALSDAGFLVAREDLALESSYWSQLPANFKYLVRESIINSKNFSSFFPMHNYPKGHIDGNHWGDALTMLQTTSNTPYFFNFHDRQSSQPAGNGAIVGPTGTGKTVVMGFLFSMAEKYQPRRIFFDKDHGAAIMVKAQGGLYSSIKRGEPTGFNPFQLDNTPENIEFLSGLLKRIAEQADGGKAIGTVGEREIANALEGLMKLQTEERSFSVLLPFLEEHRKDSVGQRLSRWGNGGDRAWVFDNPRDTLNLNNDCLGFDFTSIIDEPELRTPISAYIIYRLNKRLDGTKTLFMIDEGWKFIKDAYLGPVIFDLYKTIRKKEGLIVLGSNDAADIAESEIGKAVLQQSQWKLFLPNPAARRAEYIDALGLTEKEFKLVKNLTESSRCFLLKRKNASVVVKLDLTGMNDEIQILSGSLSSVKLMNHIQETHGHEVQNWLPKFLHKIHSNHLQS